jgi:hypothetical protein
MTLRQVGAADNHEGMWNEIRNEIIKRIPTIVDFILYAMAMTTIAAVLLGLVAVYVEYGMAVFAVAGGAFCLLGIWSERRAPVYFNDGGGFKPPGSESQQALPPPAKQPQIGRASRALVVGRSGGRGRPPRH